MTNHHFSIKTIAAIDEYGACEHCSLDNADNEVQLYFVNRDGQRQMETCCVDCVLAVVRDRAEPGVTVDVEIEAHTHRDLTARLYHHDWEPVAAARTDAALLAKAYGW